MGCTKGSPLQFCNRIDIKKSQRVPLLHFRHCDTVQKSHFFRKLFNVSKWSPFNFFEILQQTGFSKRPKCPRFYKLRHCEIFLNDLFSTCDIFRRKKLGEKLFPSLVEHKKAFFGCLSEPFIKTSWHILKTLRFLSLRYSANFRRSRLVSICRKKSIVRHVPPAVLTIRE